MKTLVRKWDRCGCSYRLVKDAHYFILEECRIDSLGDASWRDIRSWTIGTGCTDDRLLDILAHGVVSE